MKKVCAMSFQEKCHLLNEIIHPFGYSYLPCEDVFVSTFDAWQREFGYTHSYDRFAPYFNMVFDSEPVYFDYHNRTWLIEFWKGQYGINTGAEIGIYCADTIIPIHQRKRELFHTIPNEEIPVFSMRLCRSTPESNEEIADLSMLHWWLAAFRMGCYSHPHELTADFCIRFADCEMLCAFTDALTRIGYKKSALKICGPCICFPYRIPFSPDTSGCITKIARKNAQWKNRLFCQLYLFVTRPFCSTADRLVYLYFYLPLIFRRCLHLRKSKKYPHSSRNGGK